MLLIISIVGALLFLTGAILNLIVSKNGVALKVSTTILSGIMIAYLLVLNTVIDYVLKYYNFLDSSYTNTFLSILVIASLIQPILFITGRFFQNEKFQKYHFPIYCFLLVIICIVFSINAILHTSLSYDYMSNSLLITFIIPLMVLPISIFCNEKLVPNSLTNFIISIIVNSIVALLCIVSLVFLLLSASAANFMNISSILLILTLLLGTSGAICSIISFLSQKKVTKIRE